MEPAAAVEKAKALLKFGEREMRAASFAAAADSFRQAMDLARGASAERLFARSLSRLFWAMGYAGRMEEMRTVVADAGRYALSRGGEPAAEVVIRACFLRCLPPDDADAVKMALSWVRDAAALKQDPDVARAAASACMALNAMGRHKEALEVLGRAQPVLEASLGADHPDVALMLHNLCDLRATLKGGYFAEMEPMLRRAVEIQERTLAPGHPERALPLLSAGMFFLRSGRYAEAEDFLKRGLEVTRLAEGDDGQTTQMARQALGQLDDVCTRPDARKWLLDSLAAAEKGAQPLEVAQRLVALCRHYFAQRDARAAEPHYRRLRELDAGFAEPEQALLQAALGVPGKIYVLLQERADEAERLLLGQLETMERVLGERHPEVLQHLYFTGNVYRMLGRPADSLKVFERHAARDPGNAEGLMRLLDAQLLAGKDKDALKTAAEIERLTGRKPVMDASLNQIGRELTNVWHMLKLEADPDLIGAAVQGDPGACLVVGLCHAAGQGVPPNLDKARTWFERAAKGGDEIAREILAALRKGSAPEVDLQIIASAAIAWVQGRGG